MNVLAIFNRDGGTFKGADMDSICSRATAAFSAGGHEIECRPVSGDEIVDALEMAGAEKSCDVILAGGGDGTISAAASVAWKSGKTLAVLPAGTMNLYARTLGVPLDLESALSALAQARPRAADIATANGRPFIHQLSVGFHSTMIHKRDSNPATTRWTKLAASFRAFAEVVRDPPSLVARIKADGEEMSPRVSAISVSNNRFGLGHMPYAEEFDGGVLGLYWTGVLPPRRFLRLSADLMLGRWNANRDIQHRTVARATHAFPEKPTTAVAAIDGELVPLAERIEVAPRPGELSVLVPQSG